MPAPTGETGSVKTCIEGVQLGTGVKAFVPLSEGDVLPLVFGSQGSYHLPLAFRGCVLDDKVTTNVRGTVVSDQQVVVQINVPHRWIVEDDCCGVFLDVFGFLFSIEPDWKATDLIGEAVDLELQTTSGGVTYSDSVRIEVGPELQGTSTP